MVLQSIYYFAPPDGKGGQAEGKAFLLLSRFLFYAILYN